MRPKTTLCLRKERVEEICRMAVSNRTGRQWMKHRALCVLVFPVECFVDIKEMRLFWLSGSLLGLFHDLLSSRYCSCSRAFCGWIFTLQSMLKGSLTVSYCAAIIDAPPRFWLNILILKQ